jgi:hypothetical protein
MPVTSNYALRLPQSLKDEVERIAKDDKTTMNQFMIMAIAEKVSAYRTEDYFRERAKRANVERAFELLSRPDIVPPARGDVIAE